MEYDGIMIHKQYRQYKEKTDMNIYEMVFSPTGGTKKVADFLAREYGLEITNIDLTDSRKDFHKISLTEEDTAIIAIPSYSGRVPAPAAERIAMIQGNGTKAILVCIYGNRAYEDTLAELQDLAQNSGFSVVAAVAAVAEHSIAHKYAKGRPDEDDFRLLKEFAEKIAGKLKKDDFSTPAIPGNRPYRKASGTGIVPKVTKACTRCGLCSGRCPVNAIDKSNPAEVDKNKCISCMRCVSVCPHNARKVNSLLLAIIDMMLKKRCSDRKECELYL